MKNKWAQPRFQISCGIAYVLKYIQAAMQAGVEMGIYRRRSHGSPICKRSGRTDSTNESHPSVEIDKVTTRRTHYKGN